MFLLLKIKPHCFFFFFFFIQAALLLSRTMVVALNEASDQEVLIALKTSIVSDPSQILINSWSTNVSVCRWIGVTCGAKHPRIVSLNFSSFGFQGTLVPSIGNLSFLRSLDLRNNSFTGPLPREMSKLRHLKVIDLGFNAFGGQMPSWLGAMGGAIEKIFLNNNNFSGSIPRLLGNNTKLQVLNLGYNFLSGVIPQEIGNLSSLEILDLQNNGQITSSIPNRIFNLSNIEVISLAGNRLSGMLPDYMCGGITRLKELNLSQNLLDGQIPYNIHKCSKLQKLGLSNNHFNGSIPKSIGWLTNLRALMLGVNNFVGGVPIDIGNLSSLEVLRINGVSLSGQIPSFFFNMSSLMWLDLANNTLQGNLPPIICHGLPKLKMLNLQRNFLSGQVLNDIYDCPSLDSLSLSRNHFTGHIPKHVGNLTALRYLRLQSNNFTGELPAELGKLNLLELILHTNMFSGIIPSSIFNISTIRLIEFSNNNLWGQLPSTAGLRLPKLQILSMSTNKLNGPIPTSIGNLSSITLINLVSNLFSGSIPNLSSLQQLRILLLGDNNLTCESHQNQELGFLTLLTNCRLLQSVELSLNPLHCTLPTSIGNFSNALERLKLFGCGLRGSISPTIGNLSSLTGLYLDLNELSGSIPDSVGELTRLERLYLEYNMLEGVVPNTICHLGRLGDFYVSGNRLRGAIPKCIGEMTSLNRLYLDSNMLESNVPSDLWKITSLLELNLSMNNLSGSIASGVVDLNAVGIIDISLNRFSGTIPTSMGSAESLTSLSLAQNKFEGSIPQSIGNIKGLESLDLSFNDLSGRIPNSLETLKYLNRFNVSYNRLEGSIPTRGSFINFTYQSFLNNSGLCSATHLQVSPCKENTNKSKLKSKNVIIYILVPCIVLIVVFVILGILRRRKKIKHAPDIEASLLPTWRGSSYLDLQRATNAFSEGNLLGRGSFGSVYAGKLSDDLIVAVKVFNLQSEEVAKSFDTETEVLKEIRHRNLVKVIGCCSNLDFKALVYEYMPNGSLDKWLYSHNHFLDLLQRLNIAIDVASALEYLHHGLTMPVVHRDLKPSNILLDADMIAYVGDFGIAKIFDEGTLIVQTETLATVGYMAPEYGAQGVVSTGADVYSFGVVLLEMFTRRKPTDEMFDEDMSLVNWVSLSLHEGSAMTNCADANLLGEEDRDSSKKEQCLLSILSLAMECLSLLASERIKISEVVPKLKKIRTLFVANSNN